MVPYSSGNSSPSGLKPILAGLSGLLIFGALVSAMTFPIWLYNWPEPYTFYNATAAVNETKEVLCGCSEYQVCGCDYPGDTAYLDSIIGNGSWEYMNKSLVAVAEYEGKQTIFIDGTLPNGTTAAGGTEDPNAGARFGAPSIGWMLFAAMVAGMVCMVG